MATLFAIPKQQPNPRVARTDDNYIRTYTGRQFWPLDPRADEINIEDIAHHLANECRFTGATSKHYSVADHALRVSVLAERMILDMGRTPAYFNLAREVALWGLHHDDSEAYLKDMPKPLKQVPGFGDLYKAHERMIMAEVIAHFNLMPHEPSVVKQADRILCNTEKRDLVKSAKLWADVDVLPGTIRPLTPEMAEAEFLRRHDALTLALKAEHAVKQI